MPKKTSSDKKASKKRKCSAAQLRALAAGRAKRAANIAAKRAKQSGGSFATRGGLYAPVSLPIGVSTPSSNSPLYFQRGGSRQKGGSFLNKPAGLGGLYAGVRHPLGKATPSSNAPEYWLI